MTDQASQKRALGWKPDVAKYNYTTFGSVHSNAMGISYPDKNTDLMGYVPKPWLYQDELEACVGYAIAIAGYAKQRAEKLPKCVVPSPGFIWWNARFKHGAQKRNSGTYPYLAYDAVQQFGICADSAWPESELHFQFDKKPARKAFRSAYDSKFTIETQKLHGYGEDLKQQIKAAFAVQGPLTFGLMVTQSFVDLKEHKVYDGPKGADPVRGGHYMTLLGYDDLGPFGPQTWRFWGNDGWFHLGWDYFLSEASDIVTHRYIPRLA